MRLPQRGFALFISFAALTCLALSFWQVQRLQWKNGLIEARQKLFEEEALLLPPPSEWRNLDWSRFYFRRFLLVGTIHPQKTIRIFLPHPTYGAAHRIIHPLLLSGGGHVLMDLGLRPARADPLEGEAGARNPLRHAQNPKGEMSWDALFLPPESGGVFDPPPDLKKGLWFKREPQSMSRYAGVSAPPGIFQRDGTLPPLPNNHFSYALTWFALALTFALLYVLRLTQMRKGKDS